MIYNLLLELVGLPIVLALATLLLKLGFIEKLLLKLVGLPHVLELAVHLVEFLGWISQEGILSHFYY